MLVGRYTIGRLWGESLMDFEKRYWSGKEIEIVRQVLII